jgi:hypothetical protein
VATVATVAAVISYRHAYELVTTHGETRLTARLPFTVDGLILAASMLILDASRRHHPVPPLGRWCLGAGIAATVSANLAHGPRPRTHRRTGQRVGDGWCFSCGGFAGHVKVMFINGVDLKPVPPVTPVGMGKATRGVELESIEDIDARQLSDWMKQIASVPGVGGRKR